MERGDEMGRHIRINEWVHTDCKDAKLAPDYIERFVRLGKLSREDVRKVAKSCGIVVTRDGRYIDAMECRTTTAKNATEPNFSNAIALALGSTSAVPVVTVVDDGPEPRIEVKEIKLSDMDDYVPGPDFSYMLDSVKLGDNLFMVGPSGSGKSECAFQLSKAVSAIFIRQNFNGETTVDNMIGYSEIASEGGVSVTRWHDGELAKACRLAAAGKKVVYLADEVPAGKPEVLFQFHRVLERNKKDGSRTIEINGETLVIPGGNLTIMGTGNSFRMDESGAYSGSNSMNAAFCNRWTGGIFFVDYPLNEAEILVKAGISMKIADPLVTMARLIRSESAAQSSYVMCSTRQLIGIGQKAMRWGVKKGIELVYLNSLMGDERKLVDPIISGMSWPKF